MIDTETTNNIDDPIVYDIGFVVVDEKGKIYEKHSYVVADVFLDKELMQYAYFAEKIPQYWKDIKTNKRQLRKFITIKMIIVDICKQYNIEVVVAHNAKFDYRSLNLTQRFLTSSRFRYFFPYGIKIWDTLKMSKEIFGNKNDYHEFCKSNNYLTKNKQNRYTAEILYRYLTNNNDFIENHTGLEDVLIEKEIFTFCMNENPKINGALWE